MLVLQCWNHRGGNTPVLNEKTNDCERTTEKIQVQKGQHEQRRNDKHSDKIPQEDPARQEDHQQEDVFLPQKRLMFQNSGGRIWYTHNLGLSIKSCDDLPDCDKCRGAMAQFMICSKSGTLKTGSKKKKKKKRITPPSFRYSETCLQISIMCVITT
jgi:hypothetical protein